MIINLKLLYYKYKLDLLTYNDISLEIKKWKINNNNINKSKKKKINYN